MNPEFPDYGQLLLEWRKLARTGSPEERIAHLRRIISVAPAETRREWRINLVNAENSWFAALRRDLDALSETDLAGRSSQLTGEPWLTPPPEALTAAVKIRLDELRRRAAAARLDPLIDEVAAAFAAQDIDRLGKLASEWRDLAELLSDTRRREAEILLREPLVWVSGQETSRREEREFAAKQAELRRLIDDGAEYPAVDRVYRAAMLYDRPFDDGGAAANAVERLKQEYMLRLQRQSGRRRMLAILVAVLLLSGFAAGFWVMKRRREATRAENILQAAIKTGDFASAENFFRSLPAGIAVQPHISRLGESAIEKNRFETVRRAEAAVAFARLAAQLEREDCDPARAGTGLAEAENIAPLLSKADLARLVELRRLHQLRQTGLDRKRTQQFTAEAVALIDALDKLCGRLDKAPADQTEAAFAGLDKRFADLRKASAPDAEAVADVDALWKSHRENFLARRTAVEYERRFFRALQTPDSFGDYLEALGRLPLEHPELKDQYADALRMRRYFEAFILGGVSEEELTTPARAAAIARNLALKTGIRQSALYELTGETQFELKRGAEIADKLIRFIKNTPLSADLYELQLTGDDGGDYWFYSSKPMAVTSGSVFVELDKPTGACLRFSRNGNHLELAAEDNESGVILPTGFRLERPHGIRSLHGVILRQLGNRLAGVVTPPGVEAELLNSIYAVTHTAAMNPLASAELLAALLKMLAEIDPATGNPALRAFDELWQPALAGRTPDWRRPDEAARCRDLAAAAGKAVQAAAATKPDELFQHRRREQRRLLTTVFRPVFLLTPKPGGALQLHRLAGGEFPDLYTLRMNAAGNNELIKVIGNPSDYANSGQGFAGQIVWGSSGVTASAARAPR
ncbi:MAG: hypothetical protein PHI35_00375 [Victivallaceae bacterium]|nr:hypothetical protein [Victivallaceae bacterium]